MYHLNCLRVAISSLTLPAMWDNKIMWDSKINISPLLWCDRSTGSTWTPLLPKWEQFMQVEVRRRQLWRHTGNTTLAVWNSHPQVKNSEMCTAWSVGVCQTTSFKPKLPGGDAREGFRHTELTEATPTLRSDFRTCSHDTTYCWIIIL